MRPYRKITDDLCYVGANDRRIALFENAYPVPDGVSYNSYVLLDEKIVVFDAVDAAAADRYLESIASLLNGKLPDYLVVSHMEPDHSATIARLIEEYPDITVICNAKTVTLLENFFGGAGAKTLVVKDGDVLETGRHSLKFIFAPMVHWPEVMATYDATDKILFSADAFGSFGAVSNLFADEIELTAYLCEARRYYSNIVGKYGAQVASLLAKLNGAEINLICPLHGVIWRKDFDLIIEKYKKWAGYEAEEQTVAIFYASVYGHTAEAADYLAGELASNGIGNIKVFDVAKTHYSYLIAEAFKAKHLVFASVTLNNALFPAMEHFIRELSAHGMRNRMVSVIENGSWAPAAGKRMRELISEWKDTDVGEDTVTIKSALKADGEKKISEEAVRIANLLNSCNF